MHTNNKLLSGLFFFSTLLLPLHAQHSCGFDLQHEEMLQTDSAYHQQTQLLENDIRDYLKANVSANKLAGDIYTVPVAVHVVYTHENAPNNISDEQIISGIKRLNEIFADYDHAGVDTKIQFQLAGRTPDCQSTTGIVRVKGSDLPNYTSHGIDIEANDTDGIGANRLSVLNLSRWNPKKYLNIWIVHEINNNNGGAGVQAFATLPGTHPLYDGVVILYNTFGYDYDQCHCFELKPYTNQNETLAHEVGHYLGLYHTFEGDAGGTACPNIHEQLGDRVADTPAHIRTYNCHATTNVCYPNTHPFHDLKKVLHNYMGYTPQDCQYEFTPGQAERMRAVLETSRKDLLQPQTLLPVNISQPPLSCAPQTSLGIQGEYGMGITSVEIGDLKAGSGSAFQDGGYLNNWCNNASFKPDTPYSINIKTFGSYNEDLKIFIDYDNNGSFDLNEQIFSSNNSTSHVGSFITRKEVLLNTPIRLRIISDHFQFNIPDACYKPNYGQVEDYTIIFTNNTIPDIGRGLALQFDGQGDYLTTDFSANPVTESFTYEFWCKPQGDPKLCQVIFDRTPQNFSTYNFMAIWHGRIFIYFGKELLFMNAPPLAYNQWHHIAYTFTDDIQRLYINGVLVGEDQVSTVSNNPATLNIGAFYKNFLFFKGQIDELRLWRVARTGQQIRENMHLTSRILQEEGVSYFNFNSPPLNNTVADYIGSSNAALMGSATLISSSVNTGGAGATFSLNNILVNDTISTNEADATLVFSNIDSAATFTVIKQTYEVNTTAGIAGTLAVPHPTWTFISSNQKQFWLTATFRFSEPTFENLTAGSYRLYFRKVGSDAAWQLAPAEAVSVTHSDITFAGITRSGQYCVVKVN